MKFTEVAWVASMGVTGDELSEKLQFSKIYFYMIYDIFFSKQFSIKQFRPILLLFPHLLLRLVGTGYLVTAITVNTIYTDKCPD